MECPSCQSSTRVLESRSADGGVAVRRRRECRACGRRFTTFERRGPETLFVVKRNGSRQRFDRSKLRGALLRAAHKRPIEPQGIEAIVSRIEAAMDRAGGELPAGRIGELCLEELRELDRGAYLQYAGTLPPSNADLAADPAGGSQGGSVRSSREDAELPTEAA